MEPWTQTMTGKKFDVLNPTPEMVCPEDIAHALGLVCRYGGHSVRHFSVAEHCMVASDMVDPAYRVHTFLHDAAEAYVGDLITPVKRLCPEFSSIEDNVLRVIYEAFDLDMPSAIDDVAVKEADLRMLRTERDQLFGDPPDTWGACEAYAPYDVVLRCLPWQAAQQLWMQRFRDLIGDFIYD